MLRLLLLTTVANVLKVECKMSTIAAVSSALQACDFEVYGKVQGVFFRKYTKIQADKLGLHGWCKNTAQGTVVGQLEGPANQVQDMVHWLKSTGSPASRIDKAEFRNLKDIADYSFKEFSILKTNVELKQHFHTTAKRTTLLYVISFVPCKKIDLVYN